MSLMKLSYSSPYHMSCDPPLAWHPPYDQSPPLPGLHHLTAMPFHQHVCQMLHESAGNDPAVTVAAGHARRTRPHRLESELGLQYPTHFLRQHPRRILACIPRGCVIVMGSLALPVHDEERPVGRMAVQHRVIYETGDGQKVTVRCQLCVPDQVGPDSVDLFPAGLVQCCHLGTRHEHEKATGGVTEVHMPVDYAFP